METREKLIDPNKKITDAMCNNLISGRFVNNPEVCQDYSEKQFLSEGSSFLVYSYTNKWNSQRIFWQFRNVTKL